MSDHVRVVAVLLVPMMLNSLLAFDSIAPMTGSVVLAGAFSFFGGLFLARKAPDDFTPEVAEASPDLEAEVQRLSRERLHQNLVVQQQSQQLRMMQDMLDLRAIIDTPTDDPLETLERFAYKLCEATHADRAAIYFVARRAGERLRPIVQSGNFFLFEKRSAWNRHEQRLAHAAINSEEPCLYDVQALRAMQQDSPILSAAAMPIRVNGRVLGAICLSRQTQSPALECFRPLLEYSGETLSQTLRRVFDDATIRRQARHDHLTDLVNRRSFDAHISAEVERIQQGDSEVCALILADLDRFKSYNDRFGHQAGDHVLRVTARVLAQQVSHLRMGERSIVARYGGEEFAILLPNVGAAGAVRIAEGIRAAIEAETIHVRQQALKVTISLGVAECAGPSPSVESFIANADCALYQAKSNGRNCVCDSTDTPVIVS